MTRDLQISRLSPIDLVKRTFGEEVTQIPKPPDKPRSSVNIDCPELPPVNSRLMPKPPTERKRANPRVMLEASDLPSISTKFIPRPPKVKPGICSELVSKIEKDYFIEENSWSGEIRIYVDTALIEAARGQKGYQGDIEFLSQAIALGKPDSIQTALNWHRLGLVYWNIGKDQESAEQAFNKVYRNICYYPDLRRCFKAELKSCGFNEWDYSRIRGRD